MFQLIDGISYIIFFSIMIGAFSEETQILVPQLDFLFDVEFVFTPNIIFQRFGFHKREIKMKCHLVVKTISKSIIEKLKKRRIMVMIETMVTT